jgi:hypothetical protein
VMKQCQNLVESRQVQEQVWGWLGISTGSWNGRIPESVHLCLCCQISHINK